MPTGSAVQWIRAHVFVARSILRRGSVGLRVAVDLGRVSRIGTCVLAHAVVRGQIVDAGEEAAGHPAKCSDEEPTSHQRQAIRAHQGDHRDCTVTGGLAQMARDAGRDDSDGMIMLKKTAPTDSGKSLLWMHTILDPFARAVF